MVDGKVDEEEEEGGEQELAAEYRHAVVQPTTQKVQILCLFSYFK